MFNALVLPRFTYFSNVWSDGSCTYIEKLNKLQKRAARVITGSTYQKQSTEIFEKLGWERIEIILKKREHIMTFKALRGDTPRHLSDLFVPSIMTCINKEVMTENFIWKNPTQTS